jgi:hypothetical protein
MQVRKIAASNGLIEQLADVRATPASARAMLCQSSAEAKSTWL